MAITQNYVDYGAGNDTTGDGTVGTPWKTLQKAFDTCTRNATDGNQINLKAGTAHVNAAALDLTTFVAGGALSVTAPLIVRGYTSAANDGGMGEIDCGGLTMWASAAYSHIHMVDLEVHTFGDNHGVVLTTAFMHHCEVHKGASSPSGKYLISFTGNYSTVSGCYVHDAGAGAARGISNGGGESSKTISNYILLNTDTDGAGVGVLGAVVQANVILCKSTGITGITGLAGSFLVGNVCYNTTAGTGRGIYTGTSDPRTFVLNNIICGWSGAGGDGIEAIGNQNIIGYNAFYNNTANYTVADQTFINLTANDVALGADPFTDAANGDFSLTAGGKTALRGLGWPAAYLGAHANTDGHVTIGAVQYGEAEAGGGGANPMHGKLG